MNTNPLYQPADSAAVFTSSAENAVPIFAVRGAQALESIEQLTTAQRAWATANKFTGAPKTHLLIPSEDGALSAVLFGLGTHAQAEPCGPAELLLGALPNHLPSGTYALAGTWSEPELAATAWGLGSYKFRAYKARPDTSKPDNNAPAQLALTRDINAARVRQATNALWLGRDLINTPSNDMGPAELEAVARTIGSRHGADCTVITGDDLITQNFPLIHAVGRASSRAPRLIDLNWGRADAPRITIVGKGVCFDTGGLDLKPAAGMLLMKKDMGGAATAIALADIVMAAKLDVRLRVLIPAVENSIAGDAFRPGDIIASRAGHTVEIGNTDAEGRLVLADALALGDEDQPQLMITLATLTGAARVALGPDLPACFIDDDAMADTITKAGMRVGDPVWRMPFWAGYDRMIASPNADISNTGDSPFAGAVTAALFLKRFVKQAQHYAHFDIYGWRPAARALGPKGGEAQTVRAMFEVISEIADNGGKASKG